MLKKPIIIIGAPRSGTTILHHCLALHPQIWHLPAESHHILEGPLHPKFKDYQSNRCTTNDLLDVKLLSSLQKEFYLKAINLNKIIPDPGFLLQSKTLLERISRKAAIYTLGYVSNSLKPKIIRFLEKTPKNTLRIPLLNFLFPDALFIWNKRQAEMNIDSLIAGWYASEGVSFLKLKRYARAGYPIADQLELKDYSEKWWKFALVPGWQNLKGTTVADVSAWQYYQCNQIAQQDLEEIPNDRIFSLKHEDFIQQPIDIIRSILEWADLPGSSIVESFASRLPRINDATPNFNRAVGLRYPREVHAAIAHYPNLVKSYQNTKD